MINRFKRWIENLLFRWCKYQYVMMENRQTIPLKDIRCWYVLTDVSDNDWQIRVLVSERHVRDLDFMVVERGFKDKKSAETVYMCILQELRERGFYNPPSEVFKAYDERVNKGGKNDI